MNRLRWAIAAVGAALLAVFLAGGLGCSSLPVERARVKLIGPQEAWALVERGEIVVIDVRTEERFLAGHVPGALSMPYRELWSHIERLPRERGRPLLVYCGDGRYSARAAWLIKEEGWDRVLDLRGGFRAWLEAGLPVSKEMDALVRR